MLQLIDKKKKIFFYLILFVLLSTQINKNFQKKDILSQINNIEVFGLSSEENRSIINDLNSILLKNIFFIEKKEFYKILNSNNLIETFDIKKFYPDTLRINIIKTNFLGITFNNNKKYYIGSNGKLILIKNYEKIDQKYPVVFGQNSYKNFVKLKKIIDKSKFNFEEISELYFFPSGRWDVKTNKDILIKLPKKNLLKALNLSHHMITNENFKNNKIIDLRIYNNVILTNE